jgi:hypothetical protein
VLDWIGQKERNARVFNCLTQLAAFGSVSLNESRRLQENEAGYEQQPVQAIGDRRIHLSPRLAISSSIEGVYSSPRAALPATRQPTHADFGSGKPQRNH